MDNIIATEVFDHFDKTYLLDRIIGSGTGPVVRITETVDNGTRRGKYVVEVDASVLTRIRAFMEAPVVSDVQGKSVAVRKPIRLTSDQ